MTEFDAPPRQKAPTRVKICLAETAWDPVRSDVTTFRHSTIRPQDVARVKARVSNLLGSYSAGFPPSKGLTSTQTYSLLWGGAEV